MKLSVSLTQKWENYNSFLSNWVKKVFYSLNHHCLINDMKDLLNVCVCAPHRAQWGLVGEAGLVNQDGGRRSTFSHSSKRQNQKLAPCDVKQVLSVLELLN